MLRLAKEGNDIEKFSLSRWRHGDEPLRSLKLPAAESCWITAAEGEPLTGTCLNTAEMANIETLRIYGNVTSSDAKPVRVDFSRFPKLDFLMIRDVPIDAKSFETLPVGVSIYFGHLPAMTSAEMQDVLPFIWPRGIYPPDDVSLSPETLAALLTYTAGDVHLHQSTLPEISDFATAFRPLLDGTSPATLYISYDKGIPNNRAVWASSMSPNVELYPY